jgi:cytochrome c peroxidase
MNYLIQFVKPFYKKIFFLFFICASILLLQSSGKITSTGKDVEQYYLAQLNNFEKKLAAFEKSVHQKAPRKTLQQLFFQARLSYKKISILTEFYNIYETKFLNSPALQWVEEDNPLNIQDPHGLQVVEENLFSTKAPVSYPLLKDEIKRMSVITGVLSNEKNLDYKFRDELVFEALQSALIRLITLGITGFDSPVAQYSVPEAKSTLESFQSILAVYKKMLDEKDPGKYNKIKILIDRAIQFTAADASFNSFDRSVLIKKYLSPVYSLFTNARFSSGLMPEGDRAPVNPRAVSLFDTNTFNINSFSPTARYRPTKERIELGRKLFYDPVLSATKKRTCASCHKQELAFTDGLKTALAVDEKTYLLRNTPTLWNSALQKKQFYDSRTSVLENQLSDVVHNQEEMKGSLKESVTVLQNQPVYTRMFAEAYPDENDRINQYNIANAISSYIRSLISFNSDFDKYMRGDENKLSAAAKKGFNLFMGKAKCATCHFIPLFNGLTPPFFGESESEVLGVPKIKNKNAPVPDDDKGKYLFTKSPVHLYSFKTPTLRNISLTAPYMHNGVYTTLEEVMEFYNNGGGKGLKIAPPNQTLPFDKLNLSAKEVNDIIAFMKTLTDTSSLR